MRKALALALGLLLAPIGALAQTAGGNLYGTVTDDSGAVLPGAIVTLSSELGTRSTTTSSQGDFRFISLDRGRYKVTVSLPGFSSVTRDVTVTTGENINVAFSMKVANVAETVTVTADTPLVDVKKRGTATTMTTEELSNVPNARDPWGVLKNVPGVLLDRVNIAGNENGQQASVAGKGSTTGDKMWNLDGLAITDMSATGASPTYFDFGAFQEISVTTGGADLNVQSGGIGINLVTKRGTNKFHGSARGFLAHDDFASGNVPDNLKNDPRLKGSDKADHINQISDYGFDLGGPIVKDKLWFYGTWGKQDIRLTRLIQTPDKTLLPSYNVKLNWQATQNTMASAFVFNGSKQKFGRGVGYPVNETDDFLWNQDNAYVDGFPPGGLYKAEINHTFSPNFFVSAKAAYYDTGFGLTARGGPDKTYTLDYVAGEAIGSYQTYQAIRPQKTVNLDGSYFFGGLGGNNELKFGFGFRNTTTHSASHFNGNQLAGKINGPGDTVALVWRDGVVDYGGKYWSGYLGDAYTKNRFTFNVGARFDRQTARNFGSEAPANASFPNVVPAVKYTGSENLIEWSSISPRVGMSLALDQARKTVLRASYANYAEQLSFGNAAEENPIQYGYLAYEWNDRNGDRFVQPNEVNLGNFLYNFNIDPAKPGAVESSANRIDRDLKPKRDHEVVVGIDRELGANFAVGAAYTWRRTVDWEYRPRIGGVCPADATRANCRIILPTDYTLNAPGSGNGYTGFTASPDSALVTAGAGGRLRTNAEGYHTNFSGLELTLTKRLSNRWMSRMALSWNDWTENWDGTPYGVHTTASSGKIAPTEADALVQGGQVAFLSGGSGKASFYTSVKWQLYANAMVQLPWGVDFSGGLFGKQGGPYPITVRLAAGRDGNTQALATPAIDSKRYPNVWNVDLRLAKTIKFGGTGLTFSAEAFNVLNNDVVLSRSRQANTGTFISTIAGAEPGLGRIEEIISPRIVRLGVNFTF
jgi:carboxypeptidase family protein/TonB-dependent receptor-like protein